MVAWYWSVVMVLIAGSVGLVVGGLCLFSGRSNRDE